MKIENSSFLAKSFCLVDGIGCSDYEIASFDDALISAGIANYNLVRVSSILPPRAEKTEKIDSPMGSVLHIAYASIVTFREEQIASAVAVAVPRNENDIGVIMEYSGAISKKEALTVVKTLAENAMTKRRIPVQRIYSTAVEAFGVNEKYTTTFAGIALI